MGIIGFAACTPNWKKIGKKTFCLFGKLVAGANECTVCRVCVMRHLQVNEY